MYHVVEKIDLQVTNAADLAIAIECKGQNHTTMPHPQGWHGNYKNAPRTGQSAKTLAESSKNESMKIIPNVCDI